MYEQLARALSDLYETVKGLTSHALVAVAVCLVKE